ncbi:hypothetical protein AAFF_G00089490 [Aldrovandia affinis]|uniref:non-specific serine/threonine protein kinase n=1 Tax=Aldrovandia affinis TaxID=143900 RepID=A0AAD7RWD3_9TELE|nr:hypothetical protein AAFF_G00089490 [Aldrovandia affinis]
MRIQFERWSNNASSLLEGELAFPEEIAEQCKDKLYAELFRESAEFQVMTQLLGGKYCEPSEQVRAHASNVPASNVLSERDFAVLDLLVGNYLVGKKLGEGSFAKVREGLHATTGEKVAVKVIDKEKAKQDTYMTKNLRREGQIHQMIRHPNIVQLLDILETENSYYLVTELCPGGNLMNRIYEKNYLEEAEVQKYIRQLVMAVEHLHRAGVVHRDLKIENLLLDENDNIKLIDFGLSNCGEILGYTDPFSTQCGSPAYAAPELLSRKKYGRKVDVWSIGVNMYAMLTGMLPFTVEPYSIKILHTKMVNKEINPLPPHLSSGAVSLLMDLLEPDPVKRPTIQQVMANPWLHQDQGPYKPTYLNRIHIKAINHRVVLHMTENMGYKYSEVLSTVLNNRASHTLAIYFLLDGRMERQARLYQEQLEKQCEPSQTRWVINERVTSSPKPAPEYPAKSISPAKDKKVNTGSTNGRSSEAGPAGSVASSSLEYLEISPLPARTPQTIRRLETQVVGGPGRCGMEALAGSGFTAHCWDSLVHELNSIYPVPCLRLTYRPLSPSHIPSLRTTTTPSPPARTWTPEPKSPARLTEARMDPMRLNGEFPAIGISRFLRKHSLPLFFRTKPEPAHSTDLSPYHMQPLLCKTGALKTLC